MNFKARHVRVNLAQKLGISQHETAGAEHAGMQLRNGKTKMRLKDVGVWFPTL